MWLFGEIKRHDQQCAVLEALCSLVQEEMRDGATITDLQEDFRRLTPEMVEAALVLKGQIALRNSTPDTLYYRRVAGREETFGVINSQTGCVAALGR